MSENYKEAKKELYTDAGIFLILHVYRYAYAMSDDCGAFTAGRLLDRVTTVLGVVDSFTFFCAIDWLVERKFLSVIKKGDTGQAMVLEAESK